MKFAFTLITLLWLTATVNAQTPVKQRADTATDKKALLCRYWHLTQWENADKNMYWATDTMAANWIKYNADGTFIDKEEKGAYKGNWVFDEKAMSITLTQDKSKDYPAKMKLTVTKLTKSKFEFKADDFSGNPPSKIIMEPGIYKPKK